MHTNYLSSKNAVDFELSLPFFQKWIYNKAEAQLETGRTDDRNKFSDTLWEVTDMADFILDVFAEIADFFIDIWSDKIIHMFAKKR